MARFILDDGIHDDERIGQLDDAARWLFVRMISLAERRSGVGRARASFLRSKAFPHDDSKTSDQVEEWLQKIARLGLTILWERKGERFYVLPRFRKHLGYIKDLPKRVLPLPPRELLLDYPDTLEVLAPEYQADAAAAERALEAARTAPGASPGNIRGSPGEAPAEERRGEERKGEERRGGAGGSPGAPPEPPPPPLAPLTDQDKAAVAALTGKAQRAAARAPSPLVAQLADRARATIIPRGSGSLQPDAQEVAAWEEILAREPEAEWDRWWVPRLVELLKSIASSEKHGPGGSFTIASPQQLLRKSAPKDPASKLILDEMLSKFPTHLETPDKRTKRERAVFFDERTRELEVEAIQRHGRTRLKTNEEHAIRQQVEREWGERAGPAPPGEQGSPNTSTISTSSREESS